MARYQVALCCFFAFGTLPSLPASAQSDSLTLAQAAPVPKRALPIPNKPNRCGAEVGRSVPAALLHCTWHGGNAECQH
jgi:hypothetical protein